MSISPGKWPWSPLTVRELTEGTTIREAGGTAFSFPADVREPRNALTGHFIDACSEDEGQAKG